MRLADRRTAGYQFDGRAKQSMSKGRKQPERPQRRQSAERDEACGTSQETGCPPQEVGLNSRLSGHAVTDRLAEARRPVGTSEWNLNSAICRPRMIRSAHRIAATLSANWPNSSDLASPRPRLGACGSDSSIDADGSPDAFGFHEVRTANLLSKLAQRGIGTARLGAILEKLGRRYSDAASVLSQIDVCDQLLVIRDDESGLTAVDGQRLFDFLSESDPAAAIALKLETTCDADDLFEQAVRLEQAGDLESAARTYRESLLKSGPDLMPCFNLANVLRTALGRTEAAAERYRQAVEIDPEYGPAWNNLGLCLSELDEQPEAIEAWLMRDRD